MQDDQPQMALDSEPKTCMITKLCSGGKVKTQNNRDFPSTDQYHRKTTANHSYMGGSEDRRAYWEGEFHGSLLLVLFKSAVLMLHKPTPTRAHTPPSRLQSYMSREL